MCIYLTHPNCKSLSHTPENTFQNQIHNISANPVVMEKAVFSLLTYLLYGPLINSQEINNNHFNPNSMSYGGRSMHAPSVFIRSLLELLLTCLWAIMTHRWGLCEQDVCAKLNFQVSMEYPSVFITALLLWRKGLISCWSRSSVQRTILQLCIRFPSSSMRFLVKLNIEQSLPSNQCDYIWQRLYFLQHWGTTRFQLHHCGHWRLGKSSSQKTLQAFEWDQMNTLSLNHTAQHLQIERFRRLGHNTQHMYTILGLSLEDFFFWHFQSS